ncbi:protein ANTAGONIST OF LIKE HETEROCHROMATIN PROTEIN 1 [Brachypodium distachyon]|uniref:Uncharacterized protein Unp30 n=1 Tax=Brachypodium distachyon TaxID=15368 RepID=C6ZDC1_BRADI|nr:protein ANTAGONIST OF LIKE HETEROCHROMATIN PROTEIN 1 [Brachypodium distachyon]ACU01765.1 hypothetical protein [Brachypodium distachyon]|eukprot:XP_003565809.3 protein ANTAGONIST OF LIKE HETEROCHROMATIN PROTEIN 1 [Brachypodium distachyon]
MPNRRRKRDLPPPASAKAGAAAGEEEEEEQNNNGIDINDMPAAHILASLDHHRAIPFLRLNSSAAAEKPDLDGQGPSKRLAVVPPAPSALAALLPAMSLQLQRRLWVKDRSSEWWEQRSSASYPDDAFRRDFRMSRATFAMVCDALGAAVAKEDTALRAAIPVPQRVAVCVWRLATGEPLREVSKRFGIGISTCHKLVLEVSAAIRSILMPRFLQWASTAEAQARQKARFEACSGVPGVVGAMLTAHVPIIAPKLSVAAYFNRRHTERNGKTSYSVTLQGVVGPDGAFTDVCIGWPGSMPDDQVLARSALHNRAANGGMPAGSWVVAGASFPLTDWTLVPYTHHNLTWTQHAFNDKVAGIRLVAVRAFRRLKARWVCLQKRTEVKLQDLPVVLGACCVLHNICEIRGEPLAPDLLKTEAMLNDLDADNPAVPENPVRSEAAAVARDKIAHDLLHRGHAGTRFF